MISTTIYDSPFGSLLLGEYNGKLCICDWVNSSRHQANCFRIKHQLNEEFIQGQTYLLKHTIDQLKAYFNGEIENFDIPTLLIGSKFQLDVWNALLNIDYASISTYKEIAIKIGRPNAVRAVANAIGSNAISIIIPCHRIIGSNGSLIGYAGGVTVKQQLLSIELHHTKPTHTTLATK